MSLIELLIAIGGFIGIIKGGILGFTLYGWIGLVLGIFFGFGIGCFLGFLPFLLMMFILEISEKFGF